jgi:hypothetical protein
MLAGASLCPFCAYSQPIVRVVSGGCVVTCPECGAAGPTCGGAIEHAIHAWNQRIGVRRQVRRTASSGALSISGASPKAVFHYRQL